MYTLILDQPYGCELIRVGMLELECRKVGRGLVDKLSGVLSGRVFGMDLGAGAANPFLYRDPGQAVSPARTSSAFVKVYHRV